MITPQLLNLTMAAGAGGGVTSNKQFTATRINTQKITLIAPASNAGNIRVGQSVLTNAGVSANDGSFAAPTDPLTDATSLNIMSPGTVWVLAVAEHAAGFGEKYDLRRFYAQGAANDVLKVLYDVKVDL